MLPLHFGVLVHCITWGKNANYVLTLPVPKKATLELYGYIVLSISPAGVSRAELAGNMFYSMHVNKKAKQQNLKHDIWNKYEVSRQLSQILSFLLISILG